MSLKIKGEYNMENFTVKVLQECKPLVVKAESESEAKAIIENRLQENRLEIYSTQINIRSEKQHWFKSFLEDNF